MKDKNWLKEELLRDLMRFNGNPNMADYELGIASGIGSAINLTEKLDEPEKPVIPKYVAEQLEYWERNKMNILWQFFIREIPSSMLWWLEGDEGNYDKLFDAVINGYEVEKEKLYRVRAGNRYVRFNLDGSIIGVKKDNSIVCLERLSKLPFDYKKAVESGIITLEEVTE